MVVFSQTFHQIIGSPHLAALVVDHSQVLQPPFRVDSRFVAVEGLKMKG